MSISWQKLHLEDVASTNLWLQEQYSLGYDIQGMVVSTDYQTAGKGLGTNSWHSKTGENLLFSLAINTQLHASNQFLITMAVSLALIDMLKSHIGGEALNIKWPNDIWKQNKKLAGILISHMISGNLLDMTIIGIGLNVNQTEFPANLKNPASMASFSEKTYDLDKIKAELLNQLETQLTKLSQPEQLDSIKKRYLSHLLYLQEFKTYLIQDQEREAKIMEVNSFGQLVLQDRKHETLICNFKEIVFPLD